MTVALATLDDVADAANKAVPDDDADKIDRLIAKVSAAVVRYTGQHFAESTDTITVRPHDGVLRLPQLPVTELAELRQLNRVITAGMYDLDGANGYVRRVWNAPWALDYFGVDDSTGGWQGPWDPTGAPLEWGWPAVPMTATYTHGYAEDAYPPEVVMVVAEKVARAWTYGITDVQSVQLDGYAERYQRALPTGMWSPEHREILDTYRRAKVASLRLG